MAIMIPMGHTLEAGPEHCLYIGMRTIKEALTQCFEPLQEKRQRDLSKSITRKQSSFDNTSMSAFKKDITMNLPIDYEPCGTCGFDHSYEPTDSAKEHVKLFREAIIAGIYHDPIESDAIMIAYCDLALQGDSYAYEQVVRGIATKEGY
jgi:hypothetical protein